ncbi:TIGR02444 family protein [Kordiimonas sp.]|uniref:TIGR02444 family protein n=1 Tax=Kordiimonas sp. TaxID=1970157 RepID=UPI003B52EDCB
MTDHHKEERPDVQAPDIIHKLVHDPDIFWHFALEVYGKPGVKDICLEAQNSFGADINLMLLYLWCDCHRVALPNETSVALGNTSHLWQTEILGPLREIRNGMKGGSGYREFLAQELEIEKRAQKALIACMSGVEVSETPLGARGQHLTSYAYECGLSEHLLSPLLAGAQQVVRPGVP